MSHALYARDSLTEAYKDIHATETAPGVWSLNISGGAAGSTPASAAAVGQTITVTFDRPIPIFPGEFVAIAAKNVGVVTTAGVVTFLVTPDVGWIL